LTCSERTAAELTFSSKETVCEALAFFA